MLFSMVNNKFLNVSTTASQLKNSATQEMLVLHLIKREHCLHKIKGNIGFYNNHYKCGFH